jgi:dTDP-4-amino-4,6-dideoxygalactose transaminase
MAIRMTDLAWQHAQVREEIDRAFDQILTHPGADTIGFVKLLEEKVSTWLGDGTHAVAVQSGLAAQFLTLKALGIGPGDEVITAPNSDLATTAAISHTGATFVLVDIDPDTYNVIPEQVEAAITERTKAIVPVHMYGLPAEMDEINAIAKRHNLLVIEDATLAMSAEYRGQKAGILSDAGFYSFATGKVIAGTSNGGMVVTRNGDLAERVRLLKGYGQPPDLVDVPTEIRRTQSRHNHIAEGFNLKPDGMQAALVGIKFDRLQDWAERRAAAAERYGEKLAGVPGVELPVVPDYMRHSWRNFVVKVPGRDDVRAQLAEREISTGVLYIPPVHLQPVYEHLGLGAGTFPNAEAVAEKLICLPMHPGLTNDEVDQVCDVLAAAVEKVGAPA